MGEELCSACGRNRDCREEEAEGRMSGTERTEMGSAGGPAAGAGGFLTTGIFLVFSLKYLKLLSPGLSIRVQEEFPVVCMALSLAALLCLAF